jgi:hypothetical protein
MRECVLYPRQHCYVQVELFLQGRSQGGLFGLARAVVKDNHDSEAATYLDSDGSISDSLRRCAAPFLFVSYAALPNCPSLPACYDLSMYWYHNMSAYSLPGMLILT